MSISISSYFQDPAFSKNRGWRELAAAIAQQAQGLDAQQVRVAENYPDPTLWYYYRGPVAHLVLPPAATDAGSAQQVVEALARQGVARVILPLQPAANWDNANIAAGALASRYDRVAQGQVGVWPVQIYAQPVSALTPISATFANGVTLNGASLAPSQLPAGALLAVHLDWRGDATQLTGTEKVFVHLLDGNGALVAQDDRPLTFTSAQGSGTGLAAYGIWTPPNLAPGSYQLIVGIYDPGQAGAPRVRTVDGAEWVALGKLGS